MKITLSTVNTSYLHTAFGLRYLKANLNEFESKCQIKEYTTERNQKDIVIDLLKDSPDLIGFGVYIWNVDFIEQIISIIKKISPETIIVLGGPEVSYETETQNIVKLADYTICGEGDFLFYELIKTLNTLDKPQEKIIKSKLPDIKTIKLPYYLIPNEDLSLRYVYVEASRGCPYKCEYCLSSLDKSVRNFDVDLFLDEMKKLIDRGAKHFKFIDRTFNLSPTICTKIINFFYSHINKNLFLHFEMVPDRLPDELKKILPLFPAGSSQFEIGIQTLNDDVAKNISRRNDLTKAKDNFLFLAKQTLVHVHADLIVGLPGENLESFGKGFNSLLSFNPHEIQVGILKRLKGTPIARHEKTFSMLYQDKAPYNILQTKDINFVDVQRMEKFAKYWDILWNSGHFKKTILYWFQNSEDNFSTFLHFSDYVSAKIERQNLPSLLSWTEILFHYFTQHLGFDKNQVANLLATDYAVRGKRDIPSFLKSHISDKNDLFAAMENLTVTKNPQAPQRQARHLN
jgi:radical SAM superfamily enzyme YgiQ (UPF0313 family)